MNPDFVLWTLSSYTRTWLAIADVVSERLDREARDNAAGTPRAGSLDPTTIDILTDIRHSFFDVKWMDAPIIPKA